MPWGKLVEQIAEAYRKEQGLGNRLLASPLCIGSGRAMVTPVSAPKTITAQRLGLKRMFPADDATKFDRARDDRRRSGAVLNPNALERKRT
jgi:hypothetical protein